MQKTRKLIIIILMSMVVAVTVLCGQEAGVKVYKIGDIGPAGGIVFYDKGSADNGWRYLEVAPSDQSAGMRWKNKMNLDVLDGKSLVIGFGKQNTQAIVAILGPGQYAAQICDSLVLGGYDDWYLPSQDELMLLYQNLHLKGLGSFAKALYWSSSQDKVSVQYAWCIHFEDGLQYDETSSRNLKVRAIWAF